MNVSHDEVPHHWKHLFKGIGLIFLARLAFSFLALFVRETRDELPVPMILFFQNFISLLVVFPFVAKYRFKSLKPRRPVLMAAWVICALLSFFFMFLASRQITITETILLNNTAPFFVPVIAYFALKRPFNHMLWPGMMIGFIGIGWILSPDLTLKGQDLFALQIGSVCALLSGFFLAAAFISIALFRHEKMIPTLTQYYLFSSIVALPFALYYWNLPSGELIGMLILIGVLTIINQGSLLKAFHYGRASVLAPFSYSAVVYGGLIDWIVYKKVFGLSFMFGLILICLGGILTVVFRGHHHDKSNRSPPPKE